MAIQFTCPGCGHEYSLASELAGKLARCKNCKSVNRLPMAAPARTQAPPRAARRESAPLPVPAAADRFGFEDVAPIAGPRAGVDLDPGDEYQPPIPRRAPIRTARSVTREATGEPWGVPVRSAAIGCTMAGFLIQSYRLLALGKTRPDGSLESALMSILGLVGLLATILSVFGALCSFLGGNLRAFRSESWLQACGWYLAIAWAGFVVWMIWLVFTFRRFDVGPANRPQPIFVTPEAPAHRWIDVDPANPMPPPGTPFRPDLRQEPRFRGMGPIPRGPRFPNPAGR